MNDVLRISIDYKEVKCIVIFGYIWIWFLVPVTNGCFDFIRNISSRTCFSLNICVNASLEKSYTSNDILSLTLVLYKEARHDSVVLHEHFSEEGEVYSIYDQRDTCFIHIDTAMIYSVDYLRLRKGLFKIRRPIMI